MVYRFRWQTALVTTIILGCALALGLHLVPERWLHNPIIAGVNVLASIIALAWILASLRAIPSHRDRQSWLFIALSVSSYLLCDILRAVILLVRELSAVPDWCNLIYLGSFVFLWIGLLCRSGRIPHDLLSRLAMVMDILIVLSAAISITLQLAVPIALGIAETSPVLIWQGMAYPLLALVTLICINLMLLKGMPRLLRGPRALLVIAIGMVMVGGTWVAYLQLIGIANPPDMVNSLWPIGMMLYGVAARWEAALYRGVHGDIVDTDVFPSMLSMLVPIALVLAAMVLAVRILPFEPERLGLILTSLTILIVLTLIRQLIIFESNRKLYHTLQGLYREVARHAATDPLTGLANHGHFMDCLDTEVQRALRYGRSMAIIFSDLDYFKQINDSYGHHVGDHALRLVAACLCHEVRDADLVARYGGEEFIILLPETTLAQATALAERLRQAVSEIDLHLPLGEVRTLTMSCGIAALPENANTAGDLLTTADHAMYCAKQAGRNQVIAAPCLLEQHLQSVVS